MVFSTTGNAAIWTWKLDLKCSSWRRSKIKPLKVIAGGIQAFEEVCRENQSILPTINRRSSYTKFSPWLIFVKDNDSICNLVDPMQNNKQYLIKVPELLIGAKIHYSRGGWLLMSNGMKSVFFFNPFTREIIQRPYMPMDNVLHCRLLFSSLPTSSTYVVLSIGHWIRQQNEVLGDFSIYTIERGNNSWRSEKLLNMHIDMYMTWLKDPVFYNGQIYCVEDDENLGVLSIEDNITWKSLQKPDKQFSVNAAYRSFLIECGRDLLLVRVGSQGKSVGVYRLDFSELIWVEVES
ncbi:F-box protein At1g49360-like [Papaver somniferum]|uniref:F-box protein At1g49360-like n=1 Tax=Papaver somniferum TaxID=3469 RepID=UPI000E6FD205|nr:F-box protein At1g49360-like [Papaver somniferum]